MSVPNINETLPPQVSEEQCRDNGYTYRAIIELGYEDKNLNARKELTYILKYGSDNSKEKDSQFKEMLDNRYQYALNAVLGATTENPVSLDNRNSVSALRRQSAVEILDASYTSLLRNDPRGAYMAAFTIAKKIENPNEESMKIMFMGTEYEKHLTGETYAVLKFLKNIANNVENQSEGISINVFDAIIRNLKYVKDPTVYCDEEEILRMFLSKSQKLENWELYKKLIDTFYGRIEELDISKPEDYRVLNNISSIYSQLLMRERCNGSSDEKLKINKKIFKKVLFLVKGCRDYRIREGFLFPLGVAVLKDKNEEEKWEKDSKLFGQQLDFHIKTLDTLIYIVNEQRFLLEHSLPDKVTMSFHNSAYELLRRMLEEYVNGVKNRDKSWMLVSEKYSQEYKKGLQALLEGIHKGNIAVSDQGMNFVKNFLSSSILEDPNHPFKGF